MKIQKSLLVLLLGVLLTCLAVHSHAKDKSSEAELAEDTMIFLHNIYLVQNKFFDQEIFDAKQFRRELNAIDSNSVTKKMNILASDYFDIIVEIIDVISKNKEANSASNIFNHFLRGLSFDFTALAGLFELFSDDEKIKMEKLFEYLEKQWDFLVLEANKCGVSTKALDVFFAFPEPSSINTIGVYFAKGVELPKSEFTAFELYEIAASKNEPHALSNLGYIYIDGKIGDVEVVEKDKNKAKDYFERALHAGHPDKEIINKMLKKFN